MASASSRVSAAELPRPSFTAFLLRLPGETWITFSPRLAPALRPAPARHAQCKEGKSRADADDDANAVKAERSLFRPRVQGDLGALKTFMRSEPLVAQLAASDGTPRGCPAASERLVRQDQPVAQDDVPLRISGDVPLRA